MKKGEIETARLLLAHGTTPVVSCEFTQFSILDIAAARSDLTILRLLLLTKAATLIDTQSVNDDTALHLAVQAEHDNVILLLLAAGTYPKIKNKQDQTPIELARFQQKPKIANLIVQTIRNLKKAKVKEINKVHQAIAGQATEIERLKRALDRESTQTRGLKNVLENQRQALEHAVQEEAQLKPLVENSMQL